MQGIDLKTYEILDRDEVLEAIGYIQKNKKKNNTLADDHVKTIINCAIEHIEE